jgi:hypothetical protein
MNRGFRVLRSHSARRWLAATLLAAGSLGIVVATWRALTVAPLPSAETRPPLHTEMPARPSASPPERMLAAALRNPFRPERNAAPRAPGEDGWGGPAPDGSTDLGAIRLSGTAVFPGGDGVVVCEAPGAAADVVRVGESCGGHTLREVLRGEAVFRTAAGERLSIRIPGGGE